MAGAKSAGKVLTMYRGRIAPSPTGLLHLGHAQTFWIAYERARAAQGELILRVEDLDASRSRPEFIDGMIDDLRWLGIRWTQGPVKQSERIDHYRFALEKLITGKFVYPCVCSRKDVQSAARAPHAADDEPIYPGTCRDKNNDSEAGTMSWRFRVPDGEEINFIDNACGGQKFVAGRDFGDFVVWSRRNGIELAAYQLAVVVDDAAMKITEVVRGSDLLISTARQLLLYRALGLEPPTFYHCPLVNNEKGVRLAKRDTASSIRAFREQGLTPVEVRTKFKIPKTN